MSLPFCATLVCTPDIAVALPMMSPSAVVIRANSDVISLMFAATSPSRVVKSDWNVVLKCEKSMIPFAKSFTASWIVVPAT